MDRKFHVFGLGHAIMDLQVNATDDDISSFGFTKGGMTLAQTDEQERIFSRFGINEFSQSSGGSAANTLITVAQLGGTIAYGGIVGDDEFGQAYYKEMEELGIALSIAPQTGRVTGSSVILITPDAERTMVTHLGASSELSSEHINQEFIKDSEWLYVEGYLFSSPSGREAVKYAIDCAGQVGTRVALTFSDGFIVENFIEVLGEAVSKADLVFANETEARCYTGADGEKDAFAKLKQEVANVAITLGPRGALVSYDGCDAEIESCPVIAVDTTGAGDSFAGGFLYGITHGMNGAESGRLSCFLASRVVSQSGARLSGDVSRIVQDRE